MVGELFELGERVEEFREIGILGVRVVEEVGEVLNGEREGLDEVGVVVEVRGERVWGE